MTDNRMVWESAYQKRGSLWGGSTPPLPELPPGSRVLELGCGNGKVIAALSGRDCDVIGLDFSHAAVSAARSGFSGSLPLNVLLADARVLPFMHGSFDAVIARHIIGHMIRPGREQIAGEIVRVLRPGATLHFSGFSTSDFRYNQGTPLEEGTFMRGNGISTHYFSADDTRTLFSGLSCELLHESRWTLRIRGKDHVRSEIQAVFGKPAVP
jgi:SAM-dependent methyltransferase